MAASEEFFCCSACDLKFPFKSKLDRQLKSKDRVMFVESHNYAQKLPPVLEQDQDENEEVQFEVRLALTNSKINNPMHV